MSVGIGEIQLSRKPATEKWRGDSCYTRFEEWTARTARAGRCPVCDKKRRRTRSFSGTVSPFHRHPDGTPLSSAEVRAKVVAAAEAWAPVREFACPSHLPSETCERLGHEPAVLSPTACKHCGSEVAP